MEHDTGQNSLTLGLALLAGAGLSLMIVAAALGVIQGDAADNTLIGALFAAGTLMLLGGVFGWAGVVRPWESFDDINQPMYHGHKHHEDEHQDEDVLLAAGDAKAALPESSTH